YLCTRQKHFDPELLCTEPFALLSTGMVQKYYLMEKRKHGFLINREENEKDFLFGTRAVMEALRAQKEIDKILVNKELNNDLIKELLALAKQERIPVVRVPEAKLNRTTRKNHQGVIAHIS